MADPQLHWTIAPCERQSLTATKTPTAACCFAAAPAPLRLRRCACCARRHRHATVHRSWCTPVPARRRAQPVASSRHACMPRRCAWHAAAPRRATPACLAAEPGRSALPPSPSPVRLCTPTPARRRAFSCARRRRLAAVHTAAHRRALPPRWTSSCQEPTWTTPPHGPMVVHTTGPHTRWFQCEAGGPAIGGRPNSFSSILR